MASSHVQEIASHQTNSTVALAFSSNVTAGNSIIVGLRANSLTATITSVTDNLGNTYTCPSGCGPIRGTSTGISHWQYKADNIAGGACTVTVVYSVNVEVGLEIHEVSGLDTAGSFDAAASVTAGSGTPNVGTVTPSVADGFALAMVSDDGGKEAAGTGWTGFDPGNSYWYDYSERRIITSTSSITGDFTSGGGNFVGLIVAYKAASGGGGGSPTYTQLEHAIGRGSFRGMGLGMR